MYIVRVDLKVSGKCRFSRVSSHPVNGGLSRLGVMVLAVFLIISGGCATAPSPGDAKALAEFKELNDPGEPTNRGIFEVNRGLDAVLLKPVATLYRDFTPQFFQDRINDVLDNLHAPVVLLNDLLQGKVERAVTTLTRFVINSTIGILGLADMATEMGIEGHDEDFGQTLAVWGVPEGPYVMLPLFGPSNPRDAVGLVVDFLTDPFNIWAANTDRDLAILARVGTRAVDTRAIHMEALDDLEKNSLDFYATIRSLYRQRRADQINDGKLPPDMPAPGLSRNSPGPVLENPEKDSQVRYPDDAATVIAEMEDAPDQAVADAGIRSAQSAPAAVDPVTAWARSELAYRKSAAGRPRSSSAEAGPHLMIEPKAAPKFDVPTAPALRVHIEISGIALVETVESTIVR